MQGAYTMISTNLEASSLTLYLYDIIKTAMASYPEQEDQSDVIISKIPEVKTKLDEIIANHCVLAVK